MKCYACHTNEAPPFKMMCDACKRAHEEWIYEQTKQRRESSKQYRNTNRTPNSAKKAFAILGVPSTATLEEIKQAFHAKAHVTHPDKGGNHLDMVELNLAYEKVLAVKGIT